MRRKVVSQPLKGSRTVVDDVHAMTDERVASTVVWVRLKMRTDSFVSPALEIESAGVVERSEMPVVGGVPKIALQPVWPMPSYWIWCATGDCTEWRRFAFLGIIAAIELAIHQRTACTIVLDRGDAAPLQHPFKSRRDFGSNVLPVALVEYALEQCWYLLHD